jgi:hypothetical protein
MLFSDLDFLARCLWGLFPKGMKKKLLNSKYSDLSQWGVTPVVCDYTVRSDLDRAIRETGSPEEFKKVIPDAFAAENWFRFHDHYSNGEKIGS